VAGYLIQRDSLNPIHTESTRCCVGQVDATPPHKWAAIIDPNGDAASAPWEVTVTGEPKDRVR
jgi:hypothetical protein